MAGTIHKADLPSSGQRRIEGFDAARDKLDLGGVSVHAFIVVDTPEGVAFMDPWTGKQTLIVGVSLGQLTIDSFTPVQNDHLRQDLSGALAWEHGITPAAHTVYARSHEVGRIDRVAFNPGTDVVDFRYYGSREQIYLVDGAEGAIIGNYTTGQALVLLGTRAADLSPQNFLFHHAQAREDRLFLQLGFDSLPASQVIGRDDIPTAGTNAWPTAAGTGAPPSGVAGVTFAMTWNYGVNAVLSFNPATDRLDFRYFRPNEFSVAEVGGSVVITISGQNQTYTLKDVALADLDYNNVIAIEDATYQTWRGLLDGARSSEPALSVADVQLAEGNAGQRLLGFTVTLSKPAAGVVTVDYATLNGTAHAGSDFQSALGTLTFQPGQTSKQVQVALLGDTVFELDERFDLVLSNATGAKLVDARATGTIANDDTQDTTTPPALSIADLVVTEGDGDHVHFMFAVTLDRAATSPVTVDFRTIDGTAKAGIDYLATTGTLTFAPGEMTKQVHVDVAGDTRAEPQEALTLALVNPVGATLLDDAATGTILDDDTGTTAPTSASAVEFKVNDNWGSGFVGQMTLKPTAALDGWTVTFDAAFAISNIWNAEIVSRTDNHYVVRNAAWNGKVGAGAEVTFGFQAAPGGAAPSITAIALNGQPVGHHQPTPDPTPPTITVGNVTVLEGNGGMGEAVDGWLSTAGNQIVDAAGQSVKLAGVNWFGFESTNASPHGVWTRSYTEMMDQMKALGFNTIRLPFATDTLHATTASGIDYSKNPDLAGLTPLQIMDKVVAYAGQIGLKIILDHHRSSLGAGTSDNGLWYDNAHSEAQWIADWKMLANRYADQPAVIGADLHNEPHAGTWGGGGANDWAAAAERAGNAIGEVNQNWLILVEGVGSYQGNNYWWGGNLMGVRDRPIALDVPNKLVYSAHDYGNSVYAQPWFQGPDFAKNLPAKFDAAWGYIFRENIAPVLVGEFGTKLQDPKDAPWLEALTSYLAGDFNNDGTSDLPDGQQGISWTYWSWNPNSTDTGGILADDWRTVNANKMAYLQPIQFDMEGGGGGMPFATFTITLSAASAQAVSVVYRTVPGEAGANDFAATSGTLTFAPGETSKTVRVAITGDKAGEANERFGLVLSDPMGATLGIVQGTATIIDDDASGTGTLSIVRRSAWGAEGTGGSTPFTFEVTRSGSAAGTAGADWAVTGGSTAAGTTNANASDFAAGSLPTGHVTFAPGETTKTITLQVSADSIVELNDSFTVTLSNPEPGVALGTASAAGVILNDDAAPSSTLSISRLNATHSEGTGAASGFTFQVTRSGSTAGTASANWSVSGGDVAGTIATSGADFVGGILPKGVVTFSPGETSKLVTVQIAGDTVIELNESFKVTLSGTPAGVTIGTAAATAIVYNDDTPGSGTLAIKGASATRTEGASGATPFTFQVTRSGNVGGTATADWTVTGGTVAGTLAVSGSDFTGGVLPSGRISFASGETTRTVTVNVAADRSAELNESFTISLSGAQAGVSIGTASAIGIIYNDDFASTARTESLAGTDSPDVFLLGGGLDTVAGKGGTDLFLFQPASLGLAAAQATVLSDFNRSVGERIDLSAIDAIAGTTINDAFAFIGNAAFDGTAGQLRWQDLGGGTLVVQGNVNADTAADLTVYVKAAGPIDASWFAL